MTFGNFAVDYEVTTLQSGTHEKGEAGEGTRSAEEIWAWLQ